MPARSPILAVAAVTALSLASTTQGARIFVDVDAITNLQTGGSWTTAHKTLGPALARANAGDEVWVASGRYTPATPATPNPRTVSFVMPGGVTVYGGFAGGEISRAQRNPLANPTILSGDINGNDLPNFVNRADNSLEVVAMNADGSAIDGCIIEGGNANGGGASNVGAGIDVHGQNNNIVNTWFRGNTALGSGGAVAAINAGSLFVTGCLFTGNRAQGGSAIFVVDGGVVVNCTTIANNTATSSESGAISRSTNAGITIGNSILWGNSNAAGQSQEAQLANSGWQPLNVSFCNVQGGLVGLGAVASISADPGFIFALGHDGVAGTSDDNLRLRPLSACIDTALEAAVQSDLTDTDGNGIVIERLPFTIAAEPRFRDDPGMPNLSPDRGPDMGAFEFQGTSCAGDLNGDGVVNTADLTAFLGRFGSTVPVYTLGDINGDGTVNTVDLTRFLAAFGSTCPT